MNSILISMQFFLSGGGRCGGAEAGKELFFPDMNVFIEPPLEWKKTNLALLASGGHSGLLCNVIVSASLCLVPPPLPLLLHLRRTLQRLVKSDGF